MSDALGTGSVVSVLGFAFWEANVVGFGEATCLKSEVGFTLPVLKPTALFISNIYTTYEIMQIIKDDCNFDFLGKRKIAAVISALMILVGMVSIALHRGLNFGIDFRGGTNVQIRFEKQVNLDDLRKVFATREDSGEMSLQTFGVPEDNEVLLILPVDSKLAKDGQLKENLTELLKDKYPQMELRRVATIGPKVGEELKLNAVRAIFIALGLVLVYISFRFQWKFGVGTIVALIHDVCIVVGVFSMLDKEFTLTIVAALLTVVGYSLNDTIVVFDRIRENQGKYRKKGLEEIINLSTNETLSRTILTSGTTLLVVVCLFFLGGEIIHDFSFAMLVGIGVGTYSSIYIASPVLLLLNQKNPATPVKEEA
ncbi:protein translocase subunit SecF [Deltaproteobacteria bacterium TL4]